MKLCAVNHDIVHIPVVEEWDWTSDLDDPPETGPTVRIREIVLRPGEYEGRRVMRAYDQETDTLFIRHTP